MFLRSALCKNNLLQKSEKIDEAWITVKPVKKKSGDGDIYLSAFPVETPVQNCPYDTFF